MNGVGRILPCGRSSDSVFGGDYHLDNNWIVENLTNAFGVWNSKMTEMWSLLTESPQTFKGGTIWQTSHIFSSIKKLRC